MEFNEFCNVIFEIIDLEPMEVRDTSSFKDELEIDSLQMVNLVIVIAEKFKVPFERFINGSDSIQTIGGLYSIVKGEHQ
jgi:acyl carrier protein